MYEVKNSKMCNIYGDGNASIGDLEIGFRKQSKFNGENKSNSNLENVPDR